MRHVLDASALLALIWGEPGADRVRNLLPDAAIGSVNLAETVGLLAGSGASAADIDVLVGKLPCPVIVQDRASAVQVGLMLPLTAKAGLSLGDRFCLALAREFGATAWTADRQWLVIASDVGVDVQLIR